jgi:hypothetical protein
MDSKKVYTTEKVARLLSLPEWRIVRFAQMKVLGIVPTFADAEGSGSRRLYDLENVCEFALTAWLLQAGLRTDAIGLALKEVRDLGGLSHLLSQDQSKTKDYCLGIIRHQKGKIVRQHVQQFDSWPQVKAIFEKQVDTSLLIIPVGLRLLRLGIE